MQTAESLGTALPQRSLRELAGLALALILAAVTLWPILAGDFVYDDRMLVLQNPTIRDWSGLRAAWTSAYWDFLTPATAQRLGYWRPLTAVALYAGQMLGGGAAWGFHCVSLGLHLAAVGAAFFLARRLTRNTAVATVCALLFAVHPVQVEAVAWISSVNDPLYGVCVLAGLNAYLAWRERGSRGMPLLAAALFAVGLLAKENAVAFLPLVAALDLGRRLRERGESGLSWRDRLRPFWRAWAPLLAVLALYYGARVVIFDDPGAGVARITTDLRLPAGRLASLRVELFGGFLGLLAWPGETSLFREIRPQLASFDHTFLRALGWIALWLLATAAAARKGARPLLFALLVPLAGVLPALVRLESLGRFVLSDRFLYVAAFGAALLFAWLVLERLPVIPGRVLALAVVALAAWQSHGRAGDWRDEESLFRASVAASPGSVYARWGLGRVLVDRFQATGDRRLIEEALVQFEAVQDLVQPRDGSAPSPQLFFTLDDICQANLGVGYCYFYRALVEPEEYTLEEAEMIFKANVERFPDSIEALTGLAVARMHMGNPFAAEQDLRRALELDDKFQPAWFNLGQVDFRRGEFAAAAASFERALALQPGDAQTALWLGTALVEGGLDLERARELLAQAREALPKDAAVPLQLGALEARSQNWRAALEHFDAALRIDPRLGRAHLLRAKVLLQLGEADRALTALAEACRLLPSDFEAHLLAGRELAQRGFAQNAKPYLQRALEIDPEGPFAAELRAALAAIDEALEAQGSR
jgi:protein O-mannosyl-transferase